MSAARPIVNVSVAGNLNAWSLDNGPPSTALGRNLKMMVSYPAIQDAPAANDIYTVNGSLAWTGGNNDIKTGDMRFVGIPPIPKLHGFYRVDVRFNLVNAQCFTLLDNRNKPVLYLGPDPHQLEILLNESFLSDAFTVYNSAKTGASRLVGHDYVGQSDAFDITGFEDYSFSLPMSLHCHAVAQRDRSSSFFTAHWILIPV